jgi:hypothetical protein
LVFRGGLSRVLVASALVALGCDHGSTLDQADLKNAIAADQATSRALKEADDAAHDGRNAEAADLVKRVASPAGDEGVSKATAIAPRTTWGRTEKDSVVVLVSDRRREMEAYEHALRVGSDEEKLAAVTKQADIERRAAALAEEIERGP